MRFWRPAATIGRAAVSLMFFAACSHPGLKPPAPVVDGDTVARSIALCRTTEAELRERLGTPTRDGLLRRARIVSWIIRDGDVVSYLAVMLNARGVVVDLYWDIPTEVLWVPMDQCA